jgi:hypothetical protein
VSDIFDRVFGSPQVRTTAKARRKDGSVVRVSVLGPVADVSAEGMVNLARERGVSVRLEREGQPKRKAKTVYGAAAASVMRSVLAGVPAK